MLVYSIQYSRCEDNIEERLHVGDIHTSLESLEKGISDYLLEMYIGLGDKYDDFDPQHDYETYSEFYEYFTNHPDYEVDYLPKPVTLNDLESLNMTLHNTYNIYECEGVEILAVCCHNLIE